MSWNEYLSDMERQLGLWGQEGQMRLQRACVAVGGLGGIGAVSALMLSKAGIGRIRVCDRDKYETANIVEQEFATFATVGEHKSTAALKAMADHTRHGVVEGFTGDLSRAEDCAKLVAGADILVSAVDNASARIALGQAADAAGIPFIVSANIGWSVIHTVYLPGDNGYARVWADIPGLRYLESGYPDMDDSNTRSAVQERWDIWVAAASGFHPEAMRQFLREKHGYYWYTAAPAYFAASLGVCDALKIITGVGTVCSYPDTFFFDMKRNRHWEWHELGRRFAVLKNVWSEPLQVIEAAMASWHTSD